jgi:N-acetylglucosaminyldiphosphoundecaprenol N-acetyl-beta-D-mannosaminyltransferase
MERDQDLRVGNGEALGRTGMSIPSKPQTTRLVIGGLSITALTRQEWAERFLDDLRANPSRDNPPRFMTSANGQVLSLAARDPSFKEALGRADGIDADGMPLVIASRLLSPRPIPERVATTDFFHDLAAAGAARRLTFFMLGATAAENARAVAAVRSRYPGLKVVGHHGYFSLEEEDGLVAQIVASGADILWVGLGVPREHEFVVRNLHRLQGVTWVKTCGGLMNFLSGKHSRAPAVMRDLGLEWAYRLLLEPRRLFWRYAFTNIHCLYLMATRRRAEPLAE